MDPFQEDVPEQSLPAPHPERVMDSTLSDTVRTLGPYRVEEEVGRGGMGVVYRARRLDTGELLALKLMLPEIAANPHFRARFVREASLGSDLDHPNIVPIYDAGDIDGELFIAMRFVEGRDLKSLIEDGGALEPKRVLTIMRQVASALDCAHEAGVIHHDIKPQNILMSESNLADRDVVYVTDFGLVRPVGSESTSSRTGSIFGSIQYMSPEQVEGVPCDGRADVYALGCVLYECLTGEIPFDRPNEVAVLWAHVHEQAPRVTDRRPQLPGGLDRVVATALAKHPDDRYLTCGELVEELGAGLACKHRPVVMPVIRPLVKRIPRMKTEREVWAPNFFPELSRVKKVSERVNWIQVIGVTGILCLLAAALVQFAHPRGIQGAVGDVALAVGDSVLDAGDAISSVLGADDATQVRDRELRPASSDAAESSVDADARSVGRSSAGPRTAAVATARTEEPSSGKPNVNTVVPPGARRPTGKILFESTRPTVGNCCDYGIYVMNADGSGLQQVFNDPLGDEFDPIWSPDRSRIAFIQDKSLFVMNADGSAPRGVFSSGWVQDPVWSPDGSHIAFSRHNRNDASPMDDAWDVWVVAADGTNPRKLTGHGGFDRFPTWSGGRIAFAAERNGNIDIYSTDPAGRVLTRLTRAGSTELMPEFSPNGRKLAYVANRGGGFDVYVKSPQLNGTEIRITRTLEAFSPAWSPDGNWIAYSGGRSEGFAIWGEHDIYLAPINGGVPIKWTNDPPHAGYSEVWDFNPSWI